VRLARRSKVATPKSISVNEAYASAAQLETLERLCGTDDVKRAELPERPDSYFRSKVDFMPEVPVSDDVDLDLLLIKRRDVTLHRLRWEDV